MNEYAKEGKKFVEAIDTYFSEFKEAAGGDWIMFFWGRNPLPINKWPNPTKIISSMDMFSYPEGYRLPLIRCGAGGFDGYFEIGGVLGMFFNSNLKVQVSAMGAWQVSLLLVMATHIMPRVQHALYLRWTPVFSKSDISKLGISDRRRSSFIKSNKHFKSDDLPVEPKVLQIREGQKYKAIFYVWSDFGGYLKVITHLTFPKNNGVVNVKDVHISTGIERIIPYSCGVMF